MSYLRIQIKPADPLCPICGSGWQPGRQQQPAASSGPEQLTRSGQKLLAARKVGDRQKGV
jgi:hypothetical protein